MAADILSLVNDISTHALTEGDEGRTIPSFGPAYFNSRPHGGRRDICRIYGKAGIFQLTPSRRATFRPQNTGYLCMYFNSRPHGGRLNPTGTIFGWCIFQLTPSRRATRKPRKIENPEENFNSRPHGGRHRRAPSNRQHIEISTHALTEGDGNLFF